MTVSVAPSNVLIDGSYWTLPSQTPSFTPKGPGSLFTITDDFLTSTVVFTAYNMPPASDASAEGGASGLSRMVMDGHTFSRGGYWEIVDDWFKVSLPVSGGLRTVAMMATTTEGVVASTTTTSREAVVSWPTEARLVTVSASQTVVSSAAARGSGGDLGSAAWKVVWVGVAVCFLICS